MAIMFDVGPKPNIPEVPSYKPCPSEIAINSMELSQYVKYLFIESSSF